MSSHPFVPRFLLPVDGSAAAAAAARYLAALASQLPRSHVDILHVSDADRDGDPLSEPVTLMKRAGVACEAFDLPGHPAEVILRHAADRAISEIVMGSRGLGRWSGLVVGSVAMKMVQHALLPVTVVGAGTPEEATGHASSAVHRLLLAVDGSRPSLRAADYVCSLHAAGLQVGVDLAAVVGPLPPAFVQENVTPEKLQFYYRQEGDRMMQEARALLENASIPARKHIEAGFVIDRLMHVASANACRRMVLGSRGDRRLSGLLLGSVAFQALHLSKIPVTLVK